MSKLDAVQRYAYTPGCRRAFVLKYFGDPAARPTCQGCDNCLGIKHTVEAPPSRGVPKPARSRRSSGGGTKTAAPPPAEVVVGPDDAPLFAALRALRGTIAREEQVPAYVVFPDRTLAELAVRRPRTLAAMGDIRGVGPAKLDKYGRQFLDAIA